MNTRSVFCILPQIVVTFSLCSMCGCHSGVEATAPSKKSTDATPVKTVTVVQETVRRTSSQPATVHAYYSAEIRARANGFVKSIEAEIGDVVTPETILAEIEVPDLHKRSKVNEARIARLVAMEQQAVAGVDLAEAGVRSAEARWKQAESELARVDASVAAIEAEFQRTVDLVERRSLENRILDEVRKKRDSELANQAAVRSAIVSAEAEVAVAQAKVRAAEADLKAARTETEVARREQDELQVAIDYATLKAPFEGVVTRRALDPGDLIREGNSSMAGEPFFVVSQINRVRIHVPVPEIDAPYVNRGDEVVLTFPSFAGETLTGSVSRTSESLDPQTRTLLVEIELDNSERKLLPGMFGQATITLSSTATANVLPARAIRFDESGKAYVYALSDDATVSVIEVTTGWDDGTRIEVISGLEPNQQVIDSHLRRFVDGDKVRILSN